MARRGEITTRSEVRAETREVWEWATSAHGINFELAPLLRMDVPRRLEQGLAGVEPGQRLGRSWIRLLGVLPVDYDDIALERVEPGRGFLERSSLLSHRAWEHERTLEPSPGGCVVTDRVAFVPRLGVPASLTRPILAALFRHRHARLRRRFGGRPLGQAAV
jgi:ligand-binding SRPBCC domain-containing protein